MQRLIPAAAIAIAVVGFYAVAPKPNASEADRAGLFSRNREVAEANLKVRALGDTLRALNFALQRTEAWELARGLAPDPAPTTVITRPGLQPATARRFEEAVRAEFAALAGPRVPIRVLIRPDSQVMGQYRKTTVIPQGGDQPCVVIVTVSARATNLRPAAGDRLLATCGFYARFGYAGSGMRAWLEDSRGFAAAIDTVLTAYVPRDEPVRLEGAIIAEAAAPAACVAGKDEGCTAFLLDPLGSAISPRVVEATERTRPVFVSFSRSGAFPSGQTLAAMREYVGDQRFEQIWTSAENPAAAFKAATGEHVAVFARPVLLREVLPHAPGPLRGALSLLFGLSLGATAGVMAITRTRRERS